MTGARGVAAVAIGRAMRRRRRVAIGAAWALAGWMSIAAPADDAGRALFERGLGRDGREIGARLGGSGGVGLRGGAIACANCHGADGRGGGEGWIRAPDVRWFVLARPHGRKADDSGARPAYDRAALARALRAGIASDGVALDPAMPRYDLADDEVLALIAHLQALDRSEDAVALPPALVVLAPMSEDGPAERLLERWRTCPSGARHRPALRVLRYRRLDQGLRDADALARRGEVAAFFAPYLVSVEREFVRGGALRDVPVLLPVALSDLDERGAAPVLFALPSLRAQALALAREAGAGRLTVYANDATDADALAADVDDDARRRGVPLRRAHAPDAIEGAALALSALPRPDGAAPKISEWRVPAARMDVDAAAAWRARGVRVRLAFPYPPDPAALAGRWIGPDMAWAALGCELLAQLPTLPDSAADLPAWRGRLAALPPLALSGWFALPAHSSAADAIGRVELRDWQEPGR